MLRVTNIRLPFTEDSEKSLQKAICHKLGITPHRLKNYTIKRRALDARRSHQMIYYVYTVEVAVENEEEVLKRLAGRDVSRPPAEEYTFTPTGRERLTHPPLVVGSGPAGLMAGLFLARWGYRPLIIERGYDVERRLSAVELFWQTGQLDPMSNVQFGEGGAGTFSDGKLTTLINDRRCHLILRELVSAGAPEEILYAAKPHIGTDLLRGVIKNLRRRIEEYGGTVRFTACLTDIHYQARTLKAVEINNRETLPAQVLILAIGHSARDTFHMLFQRGLAMTAKPFAIGLRIEHPQALIDRAQYKKFAGHPFLPAADYKLVYHAPWRRSAYTFCMCPGGYVIAAASEPGGVVTNGMSEQARNAPNANSALLVGVEPVDFGNNHPLAGIEFQRRWEKLAYDLAGGNYAAPVQLVEDFLAGRASRTLGDVKPTYRPAVTPANLALCLPPYVVATLRAALPAFDRQLPGFARGDAVLTGVETRSSSPVRILRDSSFQASIAGIYPCGEGAGYAGGIVSAAVDGLRVAEAIASRYAPLEPGHSF